MKEEKKKITFLFVFSTYLPVFLLKFRLGELVGCIIKLRIQRVPTWHTFDVIIPFFQVFLIFGVAGSIKVCSVGIRWMRNQIPHPTSSPNRNLSKNTVRYVENTNKKSSFFKWQICQFNHYGWLILLKFYWFLNSNSQKLIFARFLIRPILDPKFPLMPWLHFCPMSSIIHFFQKLVEAVNALGRARHDSLFMCMRNPASLHSRKL